MSEGFFLPGGPESRIASVWADANGRFGAAPWAIAYEFGFGRIKIGARIRVAAFE